MCDDHTGDPPMSLCLYYTRKKLRHVIVSSCKVFSGIGGTSGQLSGEEGPGGEAGRGALQIPTRQAIIVAPRWAEAAVCFGGVREPRGKDEAQAP